ncbi:hypothetical protein L6V77_15345 [Myxococcota bacterium]|nr:hypothetical protein [Myxococcota bacterium]
MTVRLARLMSLFLPLTACAGGAAAPEALDGLGSGAARDAGAAAESVIPRGRPAEVPAEVPGTSAGASAEVPGTSAGASAEVPGTSAERAPGTDAAARLPDARPAAETPERAAAVEVRRRPLPPGRRLMGLHDVEFTPAGLAVAREALPAGGFAMRVVYSTDLDWLPAEAAGAVRAVGASLTPVVRLDYARPDASAYADGTPTAGASLPPPGDVGWCLARRDGPGALGPSRDGGTHLDCYLHFVDALLATPGAEHAHDWVIGNEFNLAVEARAFPGGRMEAGWIAAVYRAVRARIHAAPGHAEDRVFLGAVSPGPAQGDRLQSGDETLRALLAALSPAELDGLALHAYGGWVRPEDNGGWPAIDAFRAQLFGQVDLVDAAGHARTPLLLTEFSALVHPPAAPGSPGAERRADEIPRLARFLIDAYATVETWNGTPGRHPLHGAIYFTLGNAAFASEYLTPYRAGGADAGGDADRNPWAALRALAADGGPPAGPLDGRGPCVEPPQGRAPRCFDETGQCLPGVFAEVFERDGGLSAFGFPVAPAGCLTDPVTGYTFFGQWLQRQRLEYHPTLAGDARYAVSLGLLGRSAALEAGLDPDAWETCAPGERRGACECLGPPADRPIGHWVCGEMLEHWRGHGRQFDGRPGVTPEESLALQGYPVSPEVEVAVGRDGARRRVQFFERVRLERHEENCGPRDAAGRCTGPDYILQGLLGCDVGGFAPGSRRGC